MDPTAEYEAQKNPTDHKMMATIRPVVRILKTERLDTLKRRRQKKTMLSFVKPYAAEDSNCNANSIYYGKLEQIDASAAKVFAGMNLHLLYGLGVIGSLGQ